MPRDLAPTSPLRPAWLEPPLLRALADGIAADVTAGRVRESAVDDLGIAGITGYTTGSVKAIVDRHYLIRTAKAAEGAFRKRLAAEGAEG